MNLWMTAKIFVRDSKERNIKYLTLKKKIKEKFTLELNMELFIHITEILLLSIASKLFNSLCSWLPLKFNIEGSIHIYWDNTSAYHFQTVYFILLGHTLCSDTYIRRKVVIEIQYWRLWDGTQTVYVTLLTCIPY